ncbi:hypothetical protein [Providencia alcalifaciens]|uniref:hypothetical protein n=1 Tax=Providencia alcalifaciens TaxID=126385 RepID=UPI002B05DF77|nr:hypothetical protein [Providencia alcalifaciens]
MYLILEILFSVLVFPVIILGVGLLSIANLFLKVGYPVLSAYFFSFCLYNLLNLQPSHEKFISILDVPSTWIGGMVVAFVSLIGWGWFFLVRK